MHIGRSWLTSTNALCIKACPYSDRRLSAKNNWRATDKSEGKCELLRRKALADGVSVLGPLKWEKEKDDKQPPFGYTPAIVRSDTLPLERAWITAKIR
jgi:hypothetical protein